MRGSPMRPSREATPHRRKGTNPVPLERQCKNKFLFVYLRGGLIRTEQLTHPAAIRSRPVSISGAVLGAGTE